MNDDHPSWVDKRDLAARVRGIVATTGAAIGVAVKPLSDSPPVALGPLTVGAAWSTMKIPVILARYRLAGETATDIGERVAAAITDSDNEAANSLFEEIVEAKGGVRQASAYVQQGLEEAGDKRTVVNTVTPADGFSTYGQTLWTLAGGLRFYSALARGCLAPTDAGAVILRLMGEITPSQSWGLGQAEFHDASRVLFKGGWGPDPDGRYLVRQFGIVEGTNGSLAVALMGMPADGRFGSGVQVLDQLADAVARDTHPARARVQPC
jgi:hypothetical protein